MFIPQTGQHVRLGRMAQRESISSADIDADAVTDDEIADSAVEQAHLKTTTNEMTTATTNSLQLGSGGSYSFWPQAYCSVNTNQHHIVAACVTRIPGPADVQKQFQQSYVTYFHLGRQTGGTSYVQNRYIQASPPYNLGEGNIPLFMFLWVKKGSGELMASNIAPDPTWANNGPTQIRPHFFGEDGKPYRRRLKLDADLMKLLDVPGRKEELFDALDQPEHEVYEITQEVKQADMYLLPHPFISDGAKDCVCVLIDPVSDMSHRLAQIHEQQTEFDLDGSIGQLFHDDYVRFDNTPLNRRTPPGVVAVQGKWK